MTEPLLRPGRASDASALQHAHRSSPDLITQLGDIDLSTGILAEEFIERVLPFDESRRNWAIVDDNLAVGNVGVTAIDQTHGTAWVYYWLSETAHGRGLAPRALISLSEWAFDTGLFRLELGHRVNNLASCRAAMRAGFIVEGIERQKLRCGLERFDVEGHARLASDPTPPAAGLPLTH